MEHEFETDGIIKRFKTHVEEPDNRRIIFSGPFGIGKTTFIEKYFSDRASIYCAIKIDPINYSVANNEDIFGLIKHDILFRLFEFGLVENQSTHFSSMDHLPLFLMEEGSDFIRLFIQNALKTGKTLVEILDRLTGLKEKYHAKHSELEKDPEYEKVKLFLENGKHAQYLYEMDFITQKIREIIAEIRGNNISTVLIIDDLDRIDPEHIFRLFNVFSAHFGYRNEFENKFGFDKVIFVCDLVNIRSIFSARYGANTDFSGYIDKFYSSEVFSFNAQDAINLWLKANLQEAALRKLKERELHFIQMFMECLIHYNLLNMRALQKINRDGLSLVRYFSSYMTDFGFLYAYLYLRMIVGSHHELVEKVIKLKERAVDKNRNEPDDELFEYASPFLYELILPVLKYYQYESSNDTTDFTYTVRSGETAQHIQFRLRSIHRGRVIGQRTSNASMNAEEFLDALVLACENANRILVFN